MSVYKIIFNDGDLLFLPKKKQPINIQSYKDNFSEIKSIESCTNYLDLTFKIEQNTKYPDDINNNFLNKKSLIHQILEMYYNKQELDLTNKNPNYSIYSIRYYGESKLSKPKELRGIEPICSVCISTFDKRKTPIYVKDDDLWIKYSDYFSPIWRPLKDRDSMRQIFNYYIDKEKKDKVVSGDGWGNIILCNEAWILVKNIISFMQKKSNADIINLIMKLQKNNIYTPLDFSTFDCEWINYWEKIIKEIKYVNI